MATEKKGFVHSVVASSKDIIAGIVGGVALVVAGHPLDTIKVRLQTMPKPLPGETPAFTGALDCAVKTVKYEGVRGLFKGMLSPITGVPPIYAIVFGVYGGSKRALQTYPDDPLTLTRIFVAGCITGVATTVLTGPVELVKARLQVQYATQKAGEKPKFAGPFDCAKQIMKTEGIRGLFRGTVATLWRDVPGTGIYFAAYEFVRRSFAREGQKVSDIGPLKTLVAGGCAGMSIWMVMFPVDLVKSRVQIDQDNKYKAGTRGMIQCAREVIKLDGVAGLYKGIGPCLLRSFPANAACFLAVELTMRGLNKMV